MADQSFFKFERRSETIEHAVDILMMAEGSEGREGKGLSSSLILAILDRIKPIPMREVSKQTNCGRKPGMEEPWDYLGGKLMEI
jgi:hypothetical protein